MLLGEEKTEVAFWSAPQREIAPRQGTVAVVGLCYDGLPVAMAFGRHPPTIGYDVSHRKVDNLSAGISSRARS